jgi:uncharacterized protein YukE
MHYVIFRKYRRGRIKMGITADDVNKAYDELEKAFEGLAAQEDKMTKMTSDLAEYKPESRKAHDIQNRIKDMQPETAKMQRAYRRAGMKVDRVRALLEVEMIAAGR